MLTETLAALAAFAFVTSITPGPNNLMLMASGANYGFRRTVPHMLGIGVGFVVMVIAVGVGLAAVFEAIPAVLTVLQALCVAFLLYLAW
ncbi:MAG: LysE family transporter, partial [Pseudomonadota bacterium]